MLAEWARRVTDRRVLAVTVLVALAGGLAGPFGTYEADRLLPRLVFWFAVVALSMPIGIACRLVVERLIGRWSFWPKALVVSGLFALVFTPLLHLILALHLGPAGQGAVDGLHLFLGVLSMALLLNAVNFVLGPVAVGRRAAAPAAQAEAPAPAPAEGPGGAGPAAQERRLPRLAARLPEELRGEILHVSVRDHYVDVRTTRGVAALLLRFADAVAELEGVEGRQVHRSHWVAREAVAGVERSRSRVMVVLRDGTRVPVSRRHLDALAALGQRR